jgi:EAL domain-containing protein (putative c-di-GMP-specific phosphodiesterase class I)
MLKSVTISYLRSFQFDKIKIGRSFFQYISNGAAGERGPGQILQYDVDCGGRGSIAATGKAAVDRLH